MVGSSYAVKPLGRSAAPSAVEPAIADRAATRPRLAYLDNVKVALTAGVIVGHAAMTYDAVGTWIYEEKPGMSGLAKDVVGAFIGVGVLFGLGLFYLIAGLLTAAPLRRLGPRRFLVSRGWRLGVPLVAYVLIVWPVLQWWIDRAKGDRTSLATSWRHQFSGAEWQSLGTGPLWFVAILLVATAGWTLWRWGVPAKVAEETGPSPSTLKVTHLAVVSASIAALSFLLRLRFGLDTKQFLDLHVWLWPQSVALFVFGAVASERGWLTAVPAGILHVCRRSLLAAFAAMVAMIFLSNGPDSFKGGWHWESAGFAMFEGVLSVAMCVLVLDVCRRRFDTQGPVRRWMSRSAYGAFVAQGPVLVAIALAMRHLSVSGNLKFLVLAVTAVAGSFAVADAVASIGDHLGHRLGHRLGRRS
jgi:glucans biosynthesis protein C